MICKCGYQNEPDDIYCAQCGRRLTAGKKSGKGWIIAIIAVLLLAAVGLAAWKLIPWQQEDASDIVQTEPDIGPEDPSAHETTEADPTEAPTEPPREGWDEEKSCYYVSGDKVTGLQQIDGGYYYFDPETGAKQTGWIRHEESWYYFTDEGPAPGAGWYQDGKGWFYLEATGRHRTESPYTDTVGKREYILDDEGYLTRMEYMDLACIETDDTVDGRERPILMLPGTLENCTKLSFRPYKTPNLVPVEGNFWGIWIRTNGQWERLWVTPVASSEGYYEVTFPSAKTFDALCIMASDNLRADSTLPSVEVDY